MPKTHRELDEDTIRQLYCSLMAEINLRFDIINTTYQNAAGLNPAMAREICYLQFRFICEIIAVGCLVAHGEVSETKALRNTYEPGIIIKRLQRLLPDFYPQPMERKKIDGAINLVGRPDKLHLTKQELPKLWGLAGDILHRSPMVKTIDQTKKDHSDFSDIMKWGRKLSGLLDMHWITLTPAKGMVVSMKAAETRFPAISFMIFSPQSRTVEVRSTFSHR